MRLIPFAGLATLLAGCAVVPPAGNTPEQAEAAPSETVQPIAAEPRPAPSPAPAPTPSGPTTFVFDGELTQGGWIRGQAPAGTVSARLGDQAVELDSDGRFFAAFDRDAGTTAELVATLENGREVRSPVAVSPRNWDIERVDIALRPSGSSAAFMRRRQPELDAIWDARTANSPTTGWKDDFVWPVTGRISGRFGSQRIYRGEPGSYHSGLDIAQPTGTPFVAPASGIVTLATDSPFSIEGYLLIIDHGQGLNSAFLHLSRIDVREGDRVERGQTLGAIGSSGRATGPHLHWSIKWHLARLDPLLFVGPMP
ncbi:M23 family metallopeptidase [Erythrobacter alti]|uniref:M23 family metallopeptidase n=1 Tax=Erythrobacter alti TaxID=1896145 RepID=UPI0030F42450